MNRYRLMAIDDDPNVLDAYQSLFPSSSRAIDSVLDLIGRNEERSDSEDVSFEFSLECFGSGKAGVEALHQSLQEESPFAVIFLDMRMPNGWSGLETARAIRRLDESVRIILVSAYMDHTLEEIRAEIGPRFVFHSKPWNDQELGQLTRLLVSDWEYERDLQSTQRQLQETSVELLQATQAKDRFLASMSHELRTPLAAMLGYGELLEETPLQQDQRSLLQTMRVSGSSLLYLLNDMLDLSKIESGKFQIDHVPYRLSEVLREVEQIFAMRAENRGLQFEVVTREQEAIYQHQILGDGKRLAQILINLISNAVKFTQQGYVRLEVHTDGERVSYRVEDSGIGMSQQVMNRLFQPFEQADQSISGRFGGTGLGLHISRTLARLMGGDIQVESEEGVGSRFELSIPLELGELLNVADRTDSATAAAAPLSGRVLIAEDVSEMQVLIRRMVERNGVEVTVVDNGEQALQQAQQQPFDLILMDMHMPVMDGVEATRALRAGGNQTPVIALTANAMHVHRQEFEQAGCNRFLTKPIDRQLLESLLAEYLSSGAGQLVDEETMDAELMSIFFEGMEKRKRQLMDAISRQDWKQVNEIAHKVKGSAGSFGYPQLTERAAVVCDAYHHQEMEQMASETMSLIMELGAVAS